MEGGWYSNQRIPQLQNKFDNMLLTTYEASHNSAHSIKKHLDEQGVIKMEDKEDKEMRAREDK